MTSKQRTGTVDRTPRRSTLETSQGQSDMVGGWLRAIVEGSDDAIVSKDLDGIIASWNRGAERLFGYTAEEVIGRPITILFPPDRLHEEPEILETIRNGGRIEHYNTVRRRKDGSLVDISLTISPIKDQSGRIVGISKIARNITAQKHADELSNLLHAIVENSDDAIISKNLDGIITTWNKGAQRLFGYTAEEAIGRSVTILIPPERLNEEPSILETIRDGGTIDHYETVRRRKDGSLVNISLTVSPIRDGQGTVIGVSKIARDITERVRAKEKLEATVEERTAQLREAVTELEAFSYSIAHDMRAPLRAMNSYSRFLEEEFAEQLPPQGKDYVRRIANGAERLDTLIKDVLNYSKISRGEMPLANIDLEELAKEIIDSYPDLKESGATIVVQSPLPRVLGNSAALTQCLSNLLSNAVKFVPANIKPQVRVWAEKKSDYVRLWIEDNGIGMSEAGQKRIFRMFERLNPTNEFEGTGIGLTIVRKAVERMGGRVGVESQPGAGSRFWVELKRAE